MKHLFFLLLSLLLLASGCGDDEDAFDPILELGRFDGWIVTSVESDFEARVDASIAGLTEAEVQQTGRTREELRDTFDGLIAAAIDVDACDLDDALFFVDGRMIVAQGTITCPGTGDPSVLDPLDLKQYTLDLGATELSVRADDGSVESVFEITELTSTDLSLRRETTERGNILVPEVDYTITYNFRAR